MSDTLLTDVEHAGTIEEIRVRISRETSDWLEQAARQEIDREHTFAGTGFDDGGHHRAIRAIFQELSYRGEHWRYQRAWNRIAESYGIALSWQDIEGATPPRAEVAAR